MTFNCGPLFLCGVSGTTLTSEERDFIVSNNISGVVLFSKNYFDKKQLKKLTDSIQSASKSKKIIAVDHEGGRVQRFKHGFSSLPSASEISKTLKPSDCYELFSSVAKELREVGVNLNFAPCVDILTNPLCEVIGDRSFGRDVLEVSRYASSAIRGLQENGVMACAKHFPGHGDTLIDSHLELPKSERSFEDLKKEDLEVFKVAFGNGVSFNMMAHLLVSDMDDKLPASLSRKFHEHLKNNLGFKGIIISDDMEMGAITKNYGALESAELALRAGTHLVEYRSYESCKEVVSALNKKCEYDSELRRILEGRIHELSDRLNKLLL